MGWTADSTTVTADSTAYTADGGGPTPTPTPTPSSTRRSGLGLGLGMGFAIGGRRGNGSSPTPTPTPSSLDPFYLDHRVWVVEGASNGTTVSTLTAPESGATYAVVADSSGGGFGISGNDLTVADGSKFLFASGKQHDVTILKTKGDQQLLKTFRLYVVASSPTNIVYIDPRGTDGLGTNGTGASPSSPLAQIPKSLAANTVYSFARIGGLTNTLIEHDTLESSEIRAMFASVGKGNIIFTSHDRYVEKLAPKVKINLGVRYSGTRYTATDLGVTLPESAGEIVGFDLPSSTTSTTSDFPGAGATYSKIFWWPKVNGIQCFPSRCAPTSDPDVDTFTTSPPLAYEWSPDTPGVRPTNNVITTNLSAASTDPSTWPNPSAELAYYWSGLASTSRIYARSPNFFARAAAVAPLPGAAISDRAGANFTLHQKILAYDSTHGVVECEWPDPNSDSGGKPSAATGYWALLGHPYGIKNPFQYAFVGEQMIASYDPALADGFSDKLHICCRAMMHFSKGESYARWDWNMELTVTGQTELLGRIGQSTFPNSGAFSIYNSSPSPGNVGYRLPSRVIFDGWPRGAGLSINGDVGKFADDIEGGALILDTPGNCRLLLQSGGTNVTIHGPIYQSNNGTGPRFGGTGTGPSRFYDVVMAPRLDIHENGLNIGYGTESDTWIIGSYVAGSYSTAYPTQSGTSDSKRHIVNAFGSSLLLNDGVTQASFVLRCDDGLTNSLLDRIVMVGPGTKLGKAVAPTTPINGNAGLVIQRSVIDRPFGSPAGSDSLAGVTINRSMVLGNNTVFPWSGTPIMTYLATFGSPTITNCIDDSGVNYNGYLTDHMWKTLTSTDAYIAGGPEEYEDIQLWAPQLGLTLPAYGTPAPIQKPKLVIQKLYENREANVMIGSFANPNPLWAMSVPSGLGDNDYFKSSLYLGHGLITAQDLPYKPTWNIVSRLTHTVTGEVVDFTHEVPGVRVSLLAA